jgi:branched-subunit amino acid transport protein
MTLWLTLAGMGLVTFLVRVTPFFAVERLRMPDTAQRALVFVPVAVLSAILAQEVLAPGGGIAIDEGNHRIPAAIIAAAVAYFTRNVFATVAAGMVVLWLLNGVA